MALLSKRGKGSQRTRSRARARPAASRTDTRSPPMRIGSARMRARASSNESTSVSVLSALHERDGVREHGREDSIDGEPERLGAARKRDHDARSMRAGGGARQ